MLSDIFLGIENRLLIYNILIEYLTNENNISLNDIQNVGIEDRLNGIMNHILLNIDQKKLNNYKQIEDKIAFMNKNVLNICFPGFKKLIKDYKSKLQQLEKSQITSNKQDSKLNNLDITPTISNNEFKDPNILMEEMRKNRVIEQENIVSLSKYGTDKEILPIKNTNNLDNFDNDSHQNNHNNYNDHNKIVKNMIEFEDKKDEFIDKDKEFERRLKILQEKRELNFKKKLTENIPIKNEIISINKQPNNIFDKENDNKTMIDIDYDLINLNKNIKINRNINNNKSDIVNIENVESNNNINIIESKPKEINSVQKKIIKNKMIIINSSDRRWYGNWIKSNDSDDILVRSNYLNRYNFPIKFSSNSEETRSTYIKQPIKLVTSIELTDVILSTHDNLTLIAINKSDLEEDTIENDKEVSIETSIHNDKQSENNSKDITNKDITNKDITNKDITNKDIKKTIENILESNLKKNNTCKINRYIYYNIYTYPYLLMNITEYSGNILTTNEESNDNMMGRLVIGKNYINNSFCKNNDIVQGYILMKPLVSHNNCSINFDPTPLTNLDKLTIQLMKPNGEIYGSENKWNIDNINIIGLELEFDQIKLYTDPPFHPSMYLCGDTINIKMFEFLILKDNKIKIKENLNDLEYNIKNYLDNNNGFYIKKTERNPTCNLNFINNNNKDILYEFHNTINIGLPLDINEMCEYEYKINGIGKWSVGANLININIQPIYSFNISYQCNNINNKSLELSL